MGQGDRVRSSWHLGSCSAEGTVINIVLVLRLINDNGA